MIEGLVTNYNKCKKIIDFKNEIYFNVCKYIVKRNGIYYCGSSNNKCVALEEEQPK